MFDIKLFVIKTYCYNRNKYFWFINNNDFIKKKYFLNMSQLFSCHKEMQHFIIRKNFLGNIQNNHLFESNNISLNIQNFFSVYI